MESKNVISLVIKFSIMLINTFFFPYYQRWNRTLSMAQALCELQEEMANIVHSKRKRITPHSSVKIFTKRLKHNKKHMSKARSSGSESSYTCKGNFPTSKEVACLNEEFLKKRCNLGYRAEIIVRLAKIIEKGELDFELNNYKLEESFDTILYGKLMKIEGFGPFICSNIMMCVGFYKRIPSDTETIKHLKKVLTIGTFLLLKPLMFKIQVIFD